MWPNWQAWQSWRRVAWHASWGTVVYSTGAGWGSPVTSSSAGSTGQSSTVSLNPTPFRVWIYIKLQWHLVMWLTMAKIKLALTRIFFFNRLLLATLYDLNNECPTVTALKCTHGDYVVKTMLLLFLSRHQGLQTDVHRCRSRWSHALDHLQVHGHAAQKITSLCNNHDKKMETKCFQLSFNSSVPFNELGFSFQIDYYETHLMP